MRAVWMMVLGMGIAGAQSFSGAVLGSMCNGVLYGGTQQANMQGLTPPYNQLVYGKVFGCVIPVKCTLCMVTLGMIENRTDLAIIGKGQRLFRVGFNGAFSDNIDLFALAGPLTPYTRTWVTLVYDGQLRLTFSASLLNALVSSVVVKDALITSPCGTLALCVFANHEVPQGLVDGMNTVFKTVAVPLVGSEHVFVNDKQVFSPGDYNIVGNTITFITAPPVGSVIQVDYQA